MDPVVREAAARVADAEIDVLRVRGARTELLDRMARSPDFLPVPAAEPMPTQLLSYKASSLTIRIRAILNGTFDELRQTEVTQIGQVFESHEAGQRVKLHNADVQRRLAEWNLVDNRHLHPRTTLSRVQPRSSRMLLGQVTDGTLGNCLRQWKLSGTADLTMILAAKLQSNGHSR
jgi:hypothetical protein